MGVYRSMRKVVKSRRKRHARRDTNMRAYTEAYLSKHCGYDKEPCLLYSRQRFNRLARQARLGARRAMGRPATYDPDKHTYRYGYSDPFYDSEEMGPCY